MMLNNIRKNLKQRRERESLYSTANYWDSKAEELKGNAVSMWPNNHLNTLYEREQIILIKNTLPSLEGRKLLDVGCGTGRLSRWFADHGAVVTGIDFSEKALEIANQQSAKGNPSYKCLSMLSLNEKEAYEVIISWGSIVIAARDREELEDVIGRIQAALLPGGILLMLEPVHKGFLHRVLDMDITEFARVLESVGLEIKFIKPLHFWPARLFLSYIQWPNFVTKPLYHLGQFIMKIPGFRGLGDYFAICAVRK